MKMSNKIDLEDICVLCSKKSHACLMNLERIVSPEIEYICIIESKFTYLVCVPVCVFADIR